MIINVPLDKINSNPWQTRVTEPDPEYIKELALDIAQNGLLQMPVGRYITAEPNPGDPIQLAFGHNRWKAYRLLAEEDAQKDNKVGYDLMPVDIRTLSDEQMAIMAWSENEKRRDHTAIERAKAIKKRIDDFGWTNRVCAEHLGIDHSTLSNILRLLKLPEGIQNEILKGKLSERQAEALLPLFDMPEENKKLIESRNYYYNTPARIVQEALQGNSSDYLRNQVDNYFENASQDLGKAEFKLDQMFKEGDKIYCGLCKTCDRRMASRNRCFDSICFNAKTDIVRRLYLANASIKSGYDLVDETKGGHTTSLPYGPWEKEERERILATKCPNLRLEYTTDKSNDIEGYPHARLVCDKRNNSCTCIKGIDLLKREGNLPKAMTLVQTIISSEGTGEAMVEVKLGEELRLDESGAAKVLQAEPVINNLELEEVARQARRDKMAIEKQRGEIERKLAKHLLQEIEMQKPGAFYIAIHHDRYPSKGNLEMEKIFNHLANNGARAIMPSSADNVDQLVRMIDDILKRLELEPFSLEEEAEMVEPDRMEREEPSMPVF